jgi:S-adenosylmethionine:tRNA ribosyltransferase-isomerase
MEGNTGLQYRLEAYEYALPPSLIAQEPLAARESCRLLVLSRADGLLSHRAFSDLPAYLQAGDVLVLNDTKVVPARLVGEKETGGRIELLVLEPFHSENHEDGDAYTCLAKASKPPRPHSRVTLRNGLRAEILSLPEEGRVRVRFLTAEPLATVLEQAGEVPLPPYIHRDASGTEPDDATCYQTVFAREPGSVAAPTAGLHFTRELLRELQHRGVEIVTVTLHVGYGTFAPMRTGDIRQHHMHPEYAEITVGSAKQIARAKKEGRRVVAVGTTSARILEWVARDHGMVGSFSGYCDLFIYPGFQFQAIDALITNFHLPRSTLLLLVSAFAGRTAILDAYREAVKEHYRFFSYGDAMLIL